MHIITRQADPADLDAIRHVLYTTWIATYPNSDLGISIEDLQQHFGSEMDPVERANRLSLLKNPPPNTILYVGLIDNKIVGVAGLTKDREKNKLKSLYVLPEYQGKGVGSALWKVACSWFDPSKKIVVHVATYNKGAISFYERLGFVDTGKRFTEDRFRFKSGSKIPEMEMIIER